MQTSKFEFHFDLLGQEPGLWNLYTQLTFCYAQPNDTTKDRAIETLLNGLKRLTAYFPWIAGQVVRRVDPDRARFVIESFETLPAFVVRDLSDVLPSFSTYKELRFPISLLDENFIAPRNTKHFPDELDPKPVFLLQAVFIRGGLLLTFVAQHGTMDIVGQGEIVRLLSNSCHGLAFTDEEMTLGNRDRRDVVPLLDEADEQLSSQETDQTFQEPSLSCKHLSKSKSKTPPPLRHLPQTKNLWVCFSFSISSLQALKAFAIDSTDLTSTFISTDDALSAFIWQSVTKARLIRFSSDTPSTFARTVDMRRFFGASPRYPGNLASKSFTTLTFQQLCQEPLGKVASLLRESIDPEHSNIVHETCATATDLSRVMRKEPHSKRSRDLSRDLAFSSWAKLDYCYDLDFNLGLGKPSAIRRPAFTPEGEQPMEGVVYLMPKRSDGEIAVSLCLRKDDMRRLLEDEVWKVYAEYIG